jgi:hypothetical protein
MRGGGGGDRADARRFFSFSAASFFFCSLSAFALASFSSFSFACAALALYKRKNIHVINLIVISKEEDNNANSPSPL